MKGEEKVAQGETSAGSGWNSKMGGGGPQGQFLPITKACPLAWEPLDKWEAQKKSKGRKPRINKLYAPDSVNLRSESCFEPT